MSAQWLKLICLMGQIFLSTNFRCATNPASQTTQNNKLIPIIERILTNGSDLWYFLAITYKEELSEDDIQTEQVLCRYWVRKFCNDFKTSLSQQARLQTEFIAALLLKGTFSVK
jgi:hypothetical protein